MKTTIRNSAFLGIALFAALSISTITMANDDKKDTIVAPVEFRYIGKVDNQPMFQLNLSGVEGEEYLIRFRDNFGYVFYSNVVKGSLTQKFLVKTDEMEGNTVVVEVMSKKTRKTETFTIKNNQKLIDETVVAKIN